MADCIITHQQAADFVKAVKRIFNITTDITFETAVDYLTNKTINVVYSGTCPACGVVNGTKTISVTLDSPYLRDQSMTLS